MNNPERREALPSLFKDLKRYASGEDLRRDIFRFRREVANHTWERYRPRSLNAIREGNPYVMVVYSKIHHPVAKAFAIEGMLGIAGKIKQVSDSIPDEEIDLKLYEMARSFIENAAEELGADSPHSISHARGIFDLGREASDKYSIEVSLTPELALVGSNFILRMNSENNGLLDRRKGPLVAVAMEAAGKAEDKKRGDDGWMAIEFKDIKTGSLILGLNPAYADDNTLADVGETDEEGQGKKGHGEVMSEAAIALAHLHPDFALTADEVFETVAAVYDARGKFWYELDEVIDRQMPEIWIPR